ncbi:hypothetical protein SDJN03_19555, partial [Cucurbita argyrosperma subsp. sororia]
MKKVTALNQRALLGILSIGEQRTIRSEPFDEIEIEDSQANFLSQGSSVGSLGAGCYFLPTILALVSFDSASSSNSSSKGKRTVGVARLSEAAN